MCACVFAHQRAPVRSCTLVRGVWASCTRRRCVHLDGLCAVRSLNAADGLQVGVELLILSHDCYSEAYWMEGIASALHLAAQYASRLRDSAHYHSMVSDQSAVLGARLAARYRDQLPLPPAPVRFRLTSRVRDPSHTRAHPPRLAPGPTRPCAFFYEKKCN